MKVTAIVPAYNEASRIRPVLEAIRQASLVDEVLVISDGSSDRTYEAALEVPGVRAVELASNRGKAGAMCAGVARCDAEIVLFLDADLSGLLPRHVDAIVQPVREGDTDMAVGVFRGGRFWTDLAQKIAPVISGQRAIRRELFLEVPHLEEVRMGVEIALTRWARASGIRVSDVALDGVTHPMKEEKLGRIKGFGSRLLMYWEIARVMTNGRRLRNGHETGQRSSARDSR